MIREVGWRFPAPKKPTPRHDSGPLSSEEKGTSVWEKAKGRLRSGTLGLIGAAAAVQLLLLFISDGTEGMRATITIDE